MMKALKERIDLLLIYKEKKTPFYEKLPKDSAYYKHFMNLVYANRMSDVAE